MSFIMCVIKTNLFIYLQNFPPYKIRKINRVTVIIINHPLSTMWAHSNPLCVWHRRVPLSWTLWGPECNCQMASNYKLLQTLSFPGQWHWIFTNALQGQLSWCNTPDIFTTECKQCSFVWKFTNFDCSHLFNVSWNCGKSLPWHIYGLRY